MILDLMYTYDILSLGKREGNMKPKRDKQMSIRLTAAEFEAIREAAEKIHRTESDLTRLAVLAVVEALETETPGGRQARVTQM